MLRTAVFGVAVAGSLASADIPYGPYLFDDDAFADTAVVNDTGTFFWNNATTVEEALTGFSPTTGLFNIGSGTNAGDFSVGFVDFTAVDGPGADIILFDLRYSADDYEVALITGSGETLFMHFPAAAQVATGETSGPADAWAVEIDLASYGESDAIGIRFRSFPGATGLQADPTMIGVLNGVPSPGSVGVLALGGLFAGRRRR